MRNAALLLVVASLGLVNGLFTEQLPVWRQLLFPVLAVAAYLLGRHLPVRRAWMIATLVGAAGAGIAVPYFWEGVSGLACAGVFVALPWLAGAFRRQQAELVAAGRLQVRQMERLLMLNTERAHRDERERIAADLHDSLGHELALIALRSGALELDAGLSEPNRRAVAELRESAVAATDHLRATIGLLRDDAAPPADPADESIEALVERVRAAGMTATLIRDDAAAILPPLVDRAAHRVVRESLTNAARYAPGAEVTVRLEREADDLYVSVRNTAPRSAPLVPSEPGGTGLAGLRERARMLGGALLSGRLDDGYSVAARLPITKEGR
jgi:signal transduction histidine kinase